ncbi:MAG: hypothetical protein U0992_18845 [Planctomycetaceae bacterium]
MFNNVMDTFRQATETTVKLQQEMFKQWMSLCPTPPSTPGWGREIQELQQQWAATVRDLVKQQATLTESQFKAGVQNIEQAFKCADAKSPEELHAKSLELWKQCFDNLRQVSESQLRGFESVMEKWSALMTKSAS